MKLYSPIKGLKDFRPIQISDQPVYVSQAFGNVWIADRDMIIGGHSIKKGDNVYLKISGNVGHNGIDIAAPRYTPIYAPADGFIVEADSGSGFGTRVSMLTKQDFDLLMVFGHLDNYKPLPQIKWNINRIDNAVKKGDKIGEWTLLDFRPATIFTGEDTFTKTARKINSNNGFGGAIDLSQFIVKGQIMRVVRDKNGTIAIETGNADKRYLAFADLNALGILGDQEWEQIDGKLEPIYNVIKTTGNGKIIIE